MLLYSQRKSNKDIVISKYIQGGQGNLSGQIIKSVNFYFPKPEEQQKIADCLSELDTLITEQINKILHLKKKPLILILCGRSLKKLKEASKRQRHATINFCKNLD